MSACVARFKGLEDVRIVHHPNVWMTGGLYVVFWGTAAQVPAFSACRIRARVVRTRQDVVTMARAVVTPAMALRCLWPRRLEAWGWRGACWWIGELHARVEGCSRGCRGAGV
eukprot:GFKZ01004731.1.p2 GENE.GFKZ01004731.1~~GFKZ01004731.1.p2  ORF type:complete len:112 (-),score=1.48 GFKZ01004731.1:390-725(-)